MRVSREVAAQNRQSVVENAGRAFRAHGYDGIGVAALMKVAGFTHGGFYKHFASKEALAAEATAAALAANAAKWEEVAGAAHGDPMDALADWYLAPAHLSEREEGCALAALAAEAPRHGPAVGAAFAEALERWVDLVTAASPGEPPSRAAILRGLSTLVGALILARAVADEQLAADILDSARPGRAASAANA